MFAAVDISSVISSSSHKYVGAVLAPNGHIYMVPFMANSIGDFDPSTVVFSEIDISGVIVQGHKYAGGVLAANGHIYMVPHHADSVGDFDPSTGAFSTIDISNFISYDAKYVGGVLAPDGRIYMEPMLAKGMGQLHLSRQEPDYEVADGGIPVTWAALLSPYFNKY